MVGGSGNPTLPQGLSHEAAGSTISFTERGGNRGKERKPKAGVKNVKEWILNKKARRRRQGRETRPDTKYTGRKRGDKF
jgi:18S rRNA (guanine1575-N7)-methyltransferase